MERYRVPSPAKSQALGGRASGHRITEVPLFPCPHRASPQGCWCTSQSGCEWTLVAVHREQVAKGFRLVGTWAILGEGPDGRGLHTSLPHPTVWEKAGH